MVSPISAVVIKTNIVSKYSPYETKRKLNLLTRPLLKRRTARDNSNGTINDARGAQSGDSASDDQHGRRNGGAAEDRAQLENGKEYEKRPLLVSN